MLFNVIEVSSLDSCKLQTDLIAQLDSTSDFMTNSTIWMDGGIS